MGKIFRLSGILIFLALSPALAGHASVLTHAEAGELASILSESGIIRHFCVPCGDSTWSTERVRAAKALPARPDSDEWAVSVNGKSVDAAYIYVQRNGRWTNAAWAAGLKFPDIPSTLKSALNQADIQPPDSAFAFFTWSGTYSLEDSVRRAKSKHATTMDYSLNVFDLGDSLTARLEVNGIDVAHRMGLRALGQGDTVTMVLQRYLKQNFGRPYSPGATLFTLIRRRDGEISTHWGAVKPESQSVSASGFRRLDLNPNKVVD